MSPPLVPEAKATVAAGQEVVNVPFRQSPAADDSDFWNAVAVTTRTLPQELAKSSPAIQ